MKWLFPKEKVCPACGKSFIPPSWQNKYCSPECQYKAKRERQRVRNWKRYRSDGTFRTKAKQVGKDSRRRFLDFWHEGADGDKAEGYNVRLRAQGFIAKELERLGYDDIFDTTGVIYASPIDIFARKESRLHGFLVTTRGQQAPVSKAAFALARYFGLERVYVAWVKPDLSWWKLFLVDHGPIQLYLRHAELGDKYKLWCLEKGYSVKSRGLGGLLRCPKCKEYKSLSEFRLTKRGLEYACKTCEKEYDREWARKKRKEVSNGR